MCVCVCVCVCACVCVYIHIYIYIYVYIYLLNLILICFSIISLCFSCLRLRFLNLWIYHFIWACKLNSHYLLKHFPMPILFLVGTSMTGTWSCSVVPLAFCWFLLILISNCYFLLFLFLWLQFIKYFFFNNDCLTTSPI